MPERLYANVKPELLRWARETAGFTLEAAAKKLSLSTFERLAAFEAGRERPTVVQLRNAARVYKRPLAAFFLPAPPPTPEPPRDFRRLPGVDVPEPSPSLRLEMRRARRRRAVALELAAELEIPVPEFTLRADPEDDTDAVAGRGREWLGVSLLKQSSWRGEYDALNGWIAALEDREVLIFQAGAVALDEMRGFSLSEPRLPVIVLNAKDAPRARVFTLMHELTHLMLHQGGLCDPSRVGRRTRTAEERIEVFCNRVAGALLVPNAALLEDPRVSRARPTTTWSDEDLRDLAQRFAVSREVILLRLLFLDRTSEAFVRRKLEQFKREYAERTRGEGGFAPLHRRAVRDNGRHYTWLVLESLERGHITLADVSDYLGVRLKHLPRIADDVRVAITETGP